MTKAYFMISIAEEYTRASYPEVVKDLEAMPEVKFVEPVKGMCDLLVRVEAPVRIFPIANQVMSKKWVKRLNVLTVETLPAGADASQRDGNSTRPDWPPEKRDTPAVAECSPRSELCRSCL